MTVVHLARIYGLNGTGGAAIAATRLHLALLKAGMDSHFVCIRQGEPGPNVHVLPRGGLLHLAYRLLAKVLRDIWRFTPVRKSVSLNALPLPGLARLLGTLKPDAIHIHWINMDFASYEQLGALKRRFPACRFVVNLHDLFMINAIEPYPCRDTRYVAGFTRANAPGLERWLFARKRRLVERLAPAFIAPSEWVAACCRRSVIGRGRPVFVVPNIIDTQLFNWAGAPAAASTFKVLYGAQGGRANAFKGFAELRQALGRLPDDLKARIELQIFGEDSTETQVDGFPVRFFGAVRDPRQMAAIYRQADVFAFPSREETQGMTKIEALLCGCPVVAFDRTACAEGIAHRVTGWVAPDGDVVRYAQGLAWVYGHYQTTDATAWRHEIAQRTAQLMDPSRLVKKIIAVYQDEGRGRVA